MELTVTESSGDSVLFIEGGFENDGSDEETVRRNIRAHSAIEPAEPPVVLVEDHQEWGMFTVEFALWPLFQEFADVELACRSVSSCDHVEFIGR
jgi:hypothetical protein